MLHNVAKNVGLTKKSIFKILVALCIFKCTGSKNCVLPKLCLIVFHLMNLIIYFIKKNLLEENKINLHKLYFYLIFWGGVGVRGGGKFNFS